MKIFNIEEKDKNDLLLRCKHIHFIGIGGSGMCPLAEIALAKGYIVSGSDNYESDTLKRIKNKNMKIFLGHDKANLDGVDLIVYSAAIKDDNCELAVAKKMGLPIIERAEMLGLIANKYKIPIAVSGTHGKTTTTAMLTQIMITAKKDPTAVIGGKLPFIGGNSRVGDSDIIICEACEYVDSFLSLSPVISLIINIDRDHLDYFKNLDNIIKSFKLFAQKTTGALVFNGDDENVKRVIEDSLDIPLVSYGLKDSNLYYAKDVVSTGVSQTFSLMRMGIKLADITINVPGEHNVNNALAAAVTAHYLGIDLLSIVEALRDFTGVHRRFEVLGSPKGITVVDDFAHHPTEIEKTLNAAKSLGFRKIYAIFQPHTYSRTYMLLDDFAKVLSIADEVVLSEILAVREKNTYNVHAKDLKDKIENSVLFKTFDEISDYVVSVAKEGDLLLTLGGGNIYECANMILKKIMKENLSV